MHWMHCVHTAHATHKILIAYIHTYVCICKFACKVMFMSCFTWNPTCCMEQPSTNLCTIYVFLHTYVRTCIDGVPACLPVGLCRKAYEMEEFSLAWKDDNADTFINGRICICIWTFTEHNTYFHTCIVVYIQVCVYVYILTCVCSHRDFYVQYLGFYITYLIIIYLYLCVCVCVYVRTSSMSNWCICGWFCPLQFLG